MIKLKGVELPINVIVIIVLCIIILLSVMILFNGTWLSLSGPVSVESAKINACQKLALSNCDSTSSVFVENFDANKNGKINDQGDNIFDGADACTQSDSVSNDNLYMLCKCWFNADEQTCKNSVCGCNPSSGSVASSRGPPLPPRCTKPADCTPKLCDLSTNRCV